MLLIDLEDIAEHEDTVGELVIRIKNNAQRYIQLFSEVIDRVMPKPTKDISSHDDVLDVIMAQRRLKSGDNEDMDMAGFPPQLMRR